MKDRRVAWVAGAVVVVIAALVFFVARVDDAATRPQSSVPTPRESTNDPAAATTLGPVRIDIDLRQRRVPDASLQVPFLFPRRRLHASVLLPDSFAAGEYDVQVLDASRQSVASVVGRADLRAGVPTLQITLDLSAGRLGTHTLAIRRSGEGWKYYAAELK